MDQNSDDTVPLNTDQPSQDANETQQLPEFSNHDQSSQEHASLHQKSHPISREGRRNKRGVANQSPELIKWKKKGDGQILVIQQDDSLEGPRPEDKELENRFKARQINYTRQPIAHEAKTAEAQNSSFGKQFSIANRHDAYHTNEQEKFVSFDSTGMNQPQHRPENTHTRMTTEVFVPNPVSIASNESTIPNSPTDMHRAKKHSTRKPSQTFISSSMAQVETAITSKSPTKTPEKAQSLAESLQALPKRKFVISGISSQNIIN